MKRMLHTLFDNHLVFVIAGRRIEEARRRRRCRLRRRYRRLDKTMSTFTV